MTNWLSVPSQRDRSGAHGMDRGSAVFCPRVFKLCCTSDDSCGFLKKEYLGCVHGVCFRLFSPQEP
jgi:hypothetical protein